MSDFMQPIQTKSAWVTTSGTGNPNLDNQLRLDKARHDAQRIESQISSKENELEARQNDLSFRVEQLENTSIVPDKSKLYVAIGAGVILVLAFYFFYFEKD